MNRRQALARSLGAIGFFGMVVAGCEGGSSSAPSNPVDMKAAEEKARRATEEHEKQLQDQKKK